MHEQITKCICNAVALINQTLENKLPIEEGRDCPLYANGAMDSISLVTLVSFVEQSIEDEFDQSIILANEKAMSMRNSPFLSVGSLADYTAELLQEDQS